MFSGMEHLLKAYANDPTPGAYEAGKTAAEMGVNMTAGSAGMAYEAGKTAAEMGVNATTGACARTCVYVCAHLGLCVGGVRKGVHACAPWFRAHSSRTYECQ